MLFPTPTQLLLLRACLETAAEARAAWEEWSTVVDLDHVDHESCYLLPLLDKNLRAIELPAIRGWAGSKVIAFIFGRKTAGSLRVLVRWSKSFVLLSATVF
jgi:hypothetical protein